MNTCQLIAAALAGAFSFQVASAEELQSGIAVGGKITSYQATKSGGVDDGVKVGTSLCYT